MTDGVEVELRADVPLRLIRASLATAVAVGLGIGAHVAGGALLPPPDAVIMAVLVLTGLNLTLLGRPASARRLVAVVAGGQAMAHVAMTALAGHGGTHGVAGGSHHPQADVAHTSAHLWTGLSTDHAVMAIAHLAAAVGVALWLAVGENALWTLISLIGARVTCVLESPLHLPLGARVSPVGAAHRAGLRPLGLAPLTGGAARRGPPVTS